VLIFTDAVLSGAFSTGKRKYGRYVISDEARGKGKQSNIVSDLRMEMPV
jgi:hypothetical protein